MTRIYVSLFCFHISEISKDRVKDVNSHLEINQEVEATIIKLNQKGQISLSLKNT